MEKRADSPPFRARRVLLTTDFSRLSHQALPLALKVLSRDGRLRLLHVVPPVLLPSYAGPGELVPIYDAKATRRLVQSAERRLTELARGLRGVRVDVVAVEAEDPARAVVKEARRFKADLLCLSTHGRGALRRLLFGSLALKLLSLYRGRVLLLRPQHFD